MRVQGRPQLFAAKSSARAVVVAGIAAGTIDIGSAMFILQQPATKICRYICYGLIGERALSGGVSMVLLGLVLQEAMSMLIAAIYLFAMRQTTVLGSRPLLSGLVAGVVIFLVMNYFVMPLSKVGHVAHFSPEMFAKNMLAMLLFGLIIAGICRDFAAPQSKASERPDGHASQADPVRR
jgi:hypothetical protein